MSIVEGVLLFFGFFLVAGRWLSSNKWAVPYLESTFRFLRANVPGRRNNLAIYKILEELHPIKEIGKEIGSTLAILEQRVACMEMQLLLIKLKVRVSGVFTDKPAFTANAQGLYTWASEAYEGIAEMRLEEILAEGWINAVYQDDRRRVMDGWNFAVARKIDFHMTYRYCGKRTGKYWNVRCDAYVAKDECTGVCAGWVGLISEVPDSDL